MNLGERLIGLSTTPHGRPTRRRHSALLHDCGWLTSRRAGGEEPKRGQRRAEPGLPGNAELTVAHQPAVWQLAPQPWRRTRRYRAAVRTVRVRRDAASHQPVSPDLDMRVGGARLKQAPITYSATARALRPAPRITATLRARRASSSRLSSPAPNRPTARRRGATPISSASTRVWLRTKNHHS